MADDFDVPNIYMQEVAAVDIGRRRRFVDLQPEDLARIAEVKNAVLDHLDEHVDVFFDYLAKTGEAAGLLNRRTLLDKARRLKREHLVATVSGDFDRSYVDQRISLGALYSQVQLDMRVFIGAFQALMRSVGKRVMALYPNDAPAGFERYGALMKVAFFDIGIITDVMISDREHTITRQQEAIRELSTPTLQVRDRLLILPIIGVLDTFRARQLTEGLLHAIRANRAKVVVMDVTGVATVDTKVANHLLQTIAASRLMGAVVIVTGLSSDVAQSLVTLGVDLTNLNAVGDLQGGIEEAERLLGYQVMLIRGGPLPRVEA